MLDKNNVRQLAYLVKVDDIQPIVGRDRVECAVVGGWTCMVPVGAFKPGDIGVYFEIDSKCPAKEPFLFLEKKNYKIKTQKFALKDAEGNKVGQFWSQGLLMPLSDFIVNDVAPDWLVKIQKYSVDELLESEDRFLTSALEVTYAEADDNKRKAKSADKYTKMAQRMSKKFSKQPYKWLMQRMWGKKLLYLFFGRKSDKRGFPAWVAKTDEERIQNLAHIYEELAKERWVVSEKIDGTSTTFTAKRGEFGKIEFLTCSRNVVFDVPDKQCYYDTNVYLEMAEKYNMKEVLTQWLKAHPEDEWVTVQGETFGDGIQKRDYGMSDHDFRAFNLITSSRGRYGSIEGSAEMAAYGIPWVPILDIKFQLPETIAELLEAAGGTSAIDGGMREGLVLRSFDGKKSFKAVDNHFLEKYHS